MAASPPSSSASPLVRTSEPTPSDRNASITPVLPSDTEPSGIFTAPALRLPIELDVAVPVRNFKVRNLIALEREAVVETQWGHAEDLPLAARDVQLAWCEFEVIETRLAVRLTRLASQRC